MPDGFDVRGRVLRDGELAAWLAEHSLGNRFGLTVLGTGRGYGSRAVALAIVAADGDGRFLDAAALAADDEAALASWLADPGPPKAVHDVKSTMHALSGSGWTLRGVTSDTASAAYLLRPEHPGDSLNQLLIHHMRCALGEEVVRTPVESVEPQHLILQACAVLDLADALDEKLARIDSSSLLGRIEIPVSQALAEMEAIGVAVDRAAITRGPGARLLESIARDGRIHAAFRLTPGSGAVGSTNPELPTDHRVRSAFVAGEGFVELMTARYSEIEPQVVDHVSAAADLRGDIEDARRDGYITTLLGRRRDLPDLDGDEPASREVALAALIEGNAADIAKVAMLSVRAAISGAALQSRMLLALGGGMVFEVADGERDALACHVREQMARAHPFDGLLEILIGCGPTWGEAIV